MPGPTRWGFMGCGKIAADFATAMKLLPKEEHQVIVVADTDMKRAQEFATKFGIEHAFDSCEKVANFPNVDIVYVNTLNRSHLHCTKLALNGGKAVLVEKPMAVNSKQVREMVQLAREKGLFLMEGFWSRFFPVYDEVRRAVADGSIGEPTFLQGNFGHQINAARILEKKLGGGSLLDFGCYLVNFATMIFNGQRPDSIHAVGKLNDDGVDIDDCVTLKYKNGAMAQLMLSAEVIMGQTVSVFGTKGQLQVLKVFNRPDKLIVNSKEIRHPLPESKEPFFYDTEGLVYEIQHVRNYLLEGCKGSAIMPLEQSIVIMEIMDEIRRQVGVVYPEDGQ